MNVKPNQELIIEKDTDRLEVVTKSKARRLRKRNETQVFENCCSFCKSNCINSSPVIESVANEDIVTEKDTEDIKTITKSKARRLRKKYRTKLALDACSFICGSDSPAPPNLFKFFKTAQYNSGCCGEHDTDDGNNLKQNYKLEKAVEAQVCHAQYEKELEQTELTQEGVQSQETNANRSELSCLSRSPGLFKFENEVQIYHEKHDKSTKDLVLASELKQKIAETIQAKINHTKEDTKLQKQETNQFNDLKDLCDLQEVAKLVDLVKYDQNTESCNVQCNKENNWGFESPSFKLKEDINTLLQPETVPTLFSDDELLENVKNIQFSDSSKINLTNTEVFLDNTESEDRSSVSVLKTDTITNSVKDHSETDTAITQNCLPDKNTFQEEGATTEVEESSVQNIDRLSNPFSLENTEVDKSGIVPTKMADNKINIPEKSRETIKAEREAKKAAKALAKLKGKTSEVQNKNTTNNKSTEPDIIQSSETAGRTVVEDVKDQRKTAVTNKVSNTRINNEPSETNDGGKSKAELRAERRAKQEAQRAAKQQHLLEKNKVNKETDKNTRVTEVAAAVEDVKKIVTPKKTVQKDNIHEINLFKHLYHEREKAIVDIPPVNSKIHPEIIRLGAQYARKVIVGSNARCVALLVAVKKLIQDFERPSQADFIRGLEANLQESIAYLHHCRPLAVSMQNALRHLKRQMTQLSSALTDVDAKIKLSSAIDTYILEQIELADKAISITIQTKISNGDVILTYGYSSLIHKILLDAHIAEKQFRVVVVDGRPCLEGKEQLRRLTKHGIECSYILINALSYVMPEVSKVFLGAHAILANGAVMSRVGTAQVALMAKAFNIPVLVACETHKSCERVQTDSIVYNELGDANELAQGHGPNAKKSLIVNWKTRKSLNLLNITYDVTPADLVTAVVTELAILPCTSVPVILRIKPSEI
ncbi:translation initiation factor eIF-2B subunit delta isoform X2 [Colletes gigas]|nr:translation initiation factor eIF-2B subunit delta isoform X2 [Colletes gigas]XP_043265472.1 translation initiation factor eIF-2B subunit delta isoform X2 [Colletes gigas]